MKEHKHPELEVQAQVAHVSIRLCENNIRQDRDNILALHDQLNVLCKHLGVKVTFRPDGYEVKKVE